MQCFEHAFKAMGSPCEVRLYATSQAEAEEGFQAVVEEVDRLEQKYSRYLSTSLLCQINAAAGHSAVGIDEETYGLLQYADQCFHQSGGLFDITSGVLRKVWHKGMEAFW